MATLTNLESGLVGAPDDVRFRVAGPLHEVRRRVNLGYSFATSTAAVMAMPQHRKALNEALDWGWAGPSDLTTLTGP